MADTPETPKPTPAPRSTARRRAPRKTSAPKPAAAKAPAKTKQPAANAAKPARAAKAASAAKPSSAKPAAKPRAPTRTTPTVKSDTKLKAKQTVATARLRLSKAAGRVSKASEKVGGKWGSAAIAGGLAVVGAAATAALLSLRGSTSRKADAKGGAHSPDGRDASASFRAGIADENSVPDKA